MKKNVLILTMMLAMVLCACGGSSKKIEGEVNTSNEQTQETEATTEESTAAHKGYTYVYNDVVVEIDTDATSVVEQLGEPLSYFEAPSCAFEGIDKIYTYSSFEIETYPMDGKDFVSMVTFKDDSISTPEGVAIGDTVDKVKEVYGDCAEEGGMLVYEKDDMKLCFIVKDGAVISVEYKSTVLDE